jgi:glycosyltransferase involved in cell wall biosynthesis
VCGKANSLNCVSELMKREIERMRIEKEKISTFPMGVDEAFWETGKNRREKLSKRPFTILSNRNLLSIYNVSLLIRAIPIVLKEEPKTEFLIAGIGSERENLEKQAKDLNVNSSVQFLGWVPHEKMPNVLAQADIYVSTSLYDGTSVSLLEAMASGAFPIVTNIPSNREWVTDGENGFLVPTDDEKYLARKIIESLQNPSLLEKSYQKNFLITKEKVSWPKMIKKIQEIYNETLNTRSP